MWQTEIKNDSNLYNFINHCQYNKFNNKEEWFQSFWLEQLELLNYVIIQDAKAWEKNRLRKFMILIWRCTEFDKPIRL